jgi:PKD repeat protein
LITYLKYYPGDTAFLNGIVHIRLLTLAGALVLSGLFQVNAQNSPLAAFSFPSEPYNVCLNEPLSIKNQSQNALEYLWDFCPEAFTETPLIANAIAIPGLLNGWGYKVVKHGDQWTGFLLSRNNHKLFRLEFGNDPSSQPTVYDLGNPGNLLVSPQGLDIINQNGNWYGFVGKGETTTGQIVRLDFGTNLHSTPIAVGLGNFGISGTRFRDLRVIKQGVNWILLIVLDTHNALLRVNYGNSFSNTITAADISKTDALPGSSLPLGFSIIKYLGNWIVHTVSFVNNGVQQYNFGNDILSTPSFEGNFTFSSIAKPYYIKVIREADSFYGFVGNESKKLSIIKFGDFTSAPEELPNSTLPAFIGFDLLKSDSKNIIHGAVTGGTSLLQVSFENTSCPAEQTWTEKEIPLNFSYDTPGTYVIELAIEGNESQYDVSSQTVNVSALSAPTIDIEYNYICLDAPTSFVVNSNTTLLEWEWKLGDNTVSNDAGPIHEYGAADDYTVTVNVKDINNCSNTAASVISIYPSPDAELLLPATLLCTNNEHLFPTTTPDIYDGNLAYQWFVDDDPVSIDRNLLYTFTTTGSKELRLITSIPGCADEMTITTSPVEVGPIVDFSFSGTCENEVFSFKQEISDPIESYQWSFGEEASDEENPSWEFASFGHYAVSLTATNAIGCENTKTKTVNVRSKPLIDFNIAGPPNNCSRFQTLFRNETNNADGGDITEWLWDFGDINDPKPKTDRHPSHVFQSPDTYSVNLTATTAAGCTSSVQKDVPIYESPSTAFTHSAACDDVAVVFTPPPDANITDVYWEIGTSYYEERSPTHTFGSPGDYPVYLEVTAGNGCIATVNRTVHVPVRLNPDFTVAKNCVNQEAIFTDITTGIDRVIATDWSVNGNEIFSGSPLVYTFTTEGNRSVNMKVTTETGCAYQVSKQVPVYLPPAASFSSAKTTGAYPLEVEFTNTSTGATHFRWEFLDGTGAKSNDISPLYTFDREGTFDVVLTALDQHECEDVFDVSITTIAPLPDADVEMISLAENPDGSMKLIVTIENKGNTILKGTALDVDFSGNLSLRQMLEEPVLPGAKYNVVFTTSIVNPGTLRYLCVDLNVENDLSPGGNRMCRTFETQLLVFPSYPNPAALTLNLEWISHAVGNVGISLTDAVGRTIFQHHAVTQRGLNHEILDVAALENGVYYLLIGDGHKSRRQRIIVSH